MTDRWTLQQWARDQNLLPCAFNCKHLSECQASLPALRDSRSTCLSYVGRDYANAAFKLAVVGMDQGQAKEDNKVWLNDVIQRSECIDQCIDRMNENGMGQFYRGVGKLAAEILGCSEPRALRKIAQPNFVKCSAGTGMSCEATWPMYQNCAKHLVPEFDVLRPDLVIFQGGVDSAKPAFRDALRDQGYTFNAVAGGPVATYGATYGERLFYKPALDQADKAYHALFVKHASYGHLAAEWHTVVEPAIELLRASGVIPPNNGNT